MSDESAARWRFGVIYSALKEISTSQDKTGIELAWRVRSLLLISYGLHPVTPGEDENYDSLFRRELSYAQSCLEGRGMDDQKPFGRANDVREGRPVGLEALIDIEYGISWAEQPVGPPWLMGDWRKMAKLVTMICNVGMGRSPQWSGDFAPETTIRLWPISKWSKIHPWPMGSGRDGYFTRATIGISELDCVLCDKGLSQNARSLDPELIEEITSGEECNGTCSTKLDFSGGQIELESFQPKFTGRKWVSFREGPKALTDRKKKVPRHLWKSLEKAPSSFTTVAKLIEDGPDMESLKREGFREVISTLSRVGGKARRQELARMREGFLTAKFSDTSELMIDGKVINLNRVRRHATWQGRAAVNRIKCPSRESSHENKTNMIFTPRLPDDISPIFHSNERQEIDKIRIEIQQNVMGYCALCKGFYWSDDGTGANMVWFDDGNKSELREKGNRKEW